MITSASSEAASSAQVRISDARDVTLLESLFENAILNSGNNYTQNVSRSDLAGLGPGLRILQTAEAGVDSVVIVKKSFTIENRVRVTLYDQEFLISTRSSSELKKYSNTRLQDIFLNPNQLLQEPIEISRQQAPGTGPDAPDLNLTSINKDSASNFIVSVSRIAREDMLLSLRDVIKDSLFVILVQKYPPHIEDYNLLSVSQIASSVGGTSFSVLVGSRLRACLTHSQLFPDDALLGAELQRHARRDRGRQCREAGATLALSVVLLQRRLQVRQRHLPAGGRAPVQPGGGAPPAGRAGHAR